MLKSKLRKVTVILTIIMIMTLTLGLVAACGENPSDSVTSYKVTFYDGTTVIATETVEEGKKNGSQVNKIPANGQLRAALQPAALWRRSDGMAGPIAGKNILTKTEGKNEFKITLNLYKGDQFQFCI